MDNKKTIYCSALSNSKMKFFLLKGLRRNGSDVQKQKLVNHLWKVYSNLIFLRWNNSWEQLFNFTLVTLQVEIHSTRFSLKKEHHATVLQEHLQGRVFSVNIISKSWLLFALYVLLYLLFNNTFLGRYHWYVVLCKHLQYNQMLSKHFYWQLLQFNTVPFQIYKFE